LQSHVHIHTHMHRYAHARTYTRAQDAAVLVRKWLKQALSNERLSPSVRSRAGAVPASELQALAEDLCRVPGRYGVCVCEYL